MGPAPPNGCRATQNPTWNKTGGALRWGSGGWEAKTCTPPGVLLIHFWGLRSMSCLVCVIFVADLMAHKLYVSGEACVSTVKAGWLVHTQAVVLCTCVRLARTIFIRCMYGIFGREIIKYTVIYGVYLRFWPTAHLCVIFRVESDVSITDHMLFT